MIRKTFGTIDVLRGNQLPGPGRRGPASYKGQLFLEEGSGNYYKALDAGPDVEFERVVIATPEELYSAVSLPDRLSEANLNTTIGAGAAAAVKPVERRGNRTIGMGDSIMIGSDGVFRDFVGSWFSHLSEATGQRLRRVRNAGVAGQSTASMLARFAADVVAFNPDVCVLEVVTPNDIGQGLTLAQSKANIIAMINLCLAAGIRPIVCTGPPNDTTATRDRMNQTSAWLIGYANKRGIPVFDLYAPLVDPADGTYLAAYTSDGIHPNAAGQDAIVAYLSTRLPGDLNAVPILTSGAGDVTNLLANGCFVGDANADGYADGWTNVGLTAGGLTARSDGLGNWQSITGDANTDYLTVTFSGFSVGDVLAIAGEWINDSGSSNSVQVMFTGGSPYSQPRALSNRSKVFAAARTFYAEIPVPAGTTAGALRLIPGIGTTKFSRLTVRNLTALDALG